MPSSTTILNYDSDGSAPYSPLYYNGDPSYRARKSTLFKKAHELSTQFPGVEVLGIIKADGVYSVFSSSEEWKPVYSRMVRLLSTLLTSY
jgi:hypothetical protein